jgi:hypothetical protein
MEPLDRYLKAVRQYLPSKQQDDVIQELAENLRSQMEDQEAELGRPLTVDEQKAILERHGLPMAVAGRYRTDRGEPRTFAFGRTLIGPVLFPIYLKILALNAGITLALAAIAASYGALVPFAESIPAIFGHLLFQFAIITGIFILVERSAARFPDLGRDPLDPAPKDEGRIARVDTIAELIVLTVFILWWLEVPYLPRLMFGRSQPLPFLPIGPGLVLLSQVILPLSILSWIRASVALIRPRWVRLYWTISAASTAAFLGVLAFAFAAGPWLIAKGPFAAPAMARKLDLSNHWLGISLLIVGLACLVNLALVIRRLARLQRTSRASVHSLAA